MVKIAHAEPDPPALDSKSGRPWFARRIEEHWSSHSPPSTASARFRARAAVDPALAARPPAAEILERFAISKSGGADLAFAFLRGANEQELATIDVRTSRRARA